MLTRLKRLPSPALVISVIALILAVGGGSFALAISDKKSDKKIAKKVANRQITKRAPKLSVNHANTANAAGSAANATGLAGPLASGQTLIGYVDLAGHVGAGEIAPETSISFQIPLATAPALHIVPVGGPPTAACPGTAASPSAVGGNLCIYETNLVGTTGFGLPDGLNPVSGPTRFGLPGLLAAGSNGNDFIARGAWAVTAP